MRPPLIIAVLLALTLAPAYAQKLFSYDQPNPHTVPLPAAIRTLLEHDQFIADTLSNHDPALATLPGDWVLCYRISLGPAHEIDYLIQANFPLGGANTTPYWVFRMINGQPKLVLFTGGLALEIESRRSNDLYEIQTVSVTMQRLNTETYRFNGTQYIHAGEHIHPL